LQTIQNQLDVHACFVDACFLLISILILFDEIGHCNGVDIIDIDRSIENNCVRLDSYSFFFKSR